jgi:hypothetical protein
MATSTADFEAPYLPAFAEGVKQIPDWIERANKYLNDIGDGTLQAEFVTLNLDDLRNMAAVQSLLGDVNKGRVVQNTRKRAEQLVETKQAADLQQTTKSADKHLELLQPDPKKFKDPQFTISIDIAKVGFRVVMMRERNHSDEFKVKGQHKRDLGVIISIMFESFLDYRDRSHDGYSVSKFSTSLPSNHLNPVPPPAVDDTRLPFTPKVVVSLGGTASCIKVACRYLEHSPLLSMLRSMGLSSRAVRKRAIKLSGADQDTVREHLRDLTAQAAKRLNASGGSLPSARELSQGGSLNTRLIMLVAGVVVDRKKNIPREFKDRGTIAFSIKIVIALTFEAFVGYGDEGGYFHRQLAAVSKRTYAQTDTDSASVESSNLHNGDQPAKKRKLDDNVPEQMQNSSGKDTSEVWTTHLEEVERDDSGNALIPQDQRASALPKHSLQGSVLKAPTTGSALDRQDTDHNSGGKFVDLTATATEQGHKMKNPSTASKGGSRPSVTGKEKGGDHPQDASKGTGAENSQRKASSRRRLRRERPRIPGRASERRYESQSCGVTSAVHRKPPGIRESGSYLSTRINGDYQGSLA